jgi:type IV pilus assembly protein PilA
VASAIHQLLRDESGLTLVEMLIVMLIVTIMATIAIPAFGDQASKARDARAKETAHNADIALETCRLSTLFGTYDTCDADALRAIDPTLPAKPTLKVNGLGPTTFTIVVQSEPSSQKFKIRLNAKGVLSFPCTKKNLGGCPASGDWGG